MSLCAVHERLCRALRTADTLTALRACVEELASDIEADLEAPETERDSAPPTPRDSELGKEYGV